MRKSKKQKEQDLMKLHTLVMKKLDEAMMSVEASKQWKKIKADYGFTVVMSWVVEECLYRTYLGEPFTPTLLDLPSLFQQDDPFFLCLF